MYLRSRNRADFAGMSRKVFVNRVLVALIRMLTPHGPPEGGSSTRRSSPSSPPPACQAYALQSYCRPCEQVGGDWLGISMDGADGLWVLVADVTGHGYPAYILADGLSHLWRTATITERLTKSEEPRDVLDALDRELEAVLPDEVFVEAMLGRFPAAGRPRSPAPGCAVSSCGGLVAGRSKCTPLVGPI